MLQGQVSPRLFKRTEFITLYPNLIDIAAKWRIL